MNRTTTDRTRTGTRVRRPVRALAVATALLLTAGTAGVAVAAGGDGADDARPAASASAGKRAAAALTGSAKMYRKTTEDVTFTFDARLAAADNKRPDKATGTFEFVHLDRPGGDGGWARGRIDCLVTGGKVATATGIITETSPDARMRSLRGGRVGFSVHDQGRHDRVGYSWGATGGPDGTKKLSKCNSVAPFEKVRKGTGDFRVLPWKVPYPTA
ncbi:Repetin [Streptomyces sp. NPDC050703]|uniref:Repetin n=1 Tax=Streptomyces sp. NPDC050703 TaxID=3157218 RepID=UPI0034318F76